MTTDLLKRLRFYSHATIVTLVSLLIYNVINFIILRETSQFVIFVITVVGMIFIPIKENAYNYHKQDMYLTLTNVYQISVQYNNLAGANFAVFVILTTLVLSVIAIIAMRANFRRSPSYSQMSHDDESQFEVGASSLSSEEEEEKSVEAQD